MTEDVPGPIVGHDGTRIVFWRLKRGTRYAKRSYGLGATIYFPESDGRGTVTTWGLSLKQYMNVIPGVPKLGRLLGKTQKNGDVRG